MIRMLSGQSTSASRKRESFPTQATIVKAFSRASNFCCFTNSPTSLAELLLLSAGDGISGLSASAALNTWSTGPALFFPLARSKNVKHPSRTTAVRQAPELTDKAARALIEEAIIANESLSLDLSGDIPCMSCAFARKLNKFVNALTPLFANTMLQCSSSTAIFAIVVAAFTTRSTESTSATCKCCSIFSNCDKRGKANCLIGSQHPLSEDKSRNTRAARPEISILCDTKHCATDETQP